MLANCHGVMHTVGRTYALDEGLSLGDLQDVLPRSNDPGCSAGFAHGLVTGVAPSIDIRRPSRATRTSAPTRERGTAATAASTGSGTPSCGSTATDCRRRSRCAARSGPGRRPTAPRAPTTTTGSRSPARTRRRCPRGRPRIRAPLCEPADRVRAPVLVPRVRRQPARGHRRRLGRSISTSSAASSAACSGRRASPGAAVIGPADPEQQLELCAGLRIDGRGRLHPRDEGAEPARRVDGRVRAAASSAASSSPARRGPLATGGSARRSNVLTDGAFARKGCPLLEARGRPPCVSGGRPQLGKARS